ncbi:hypothetical protein K2X85_17540 [bacterium]|nr:hypothetical protein [bacterium]
MLVATGAASAQGQAQLGAGSGAEHSTGAEHAEAAQSEPEQLSTAEHEQAQWHFLWNIRLNRPHLWRLTLAHEQAEAAHESEQAGSSTEQVGAEQAGAEQADAQWFL